MIEKVEKLALFLKSGNFDKESAVTEINGFYDSLENNEKQIIKSMEILCDVFDVNNPEGTKYASLICGNLAEKGFMSDYILQKYIDFTKLLIDTTAPFFDKFDDFLEKNDELYLQYASEINHYGLQVHSFGCD